MRKLSNFGVCTIIPNKLIQFIKIIPFDVILPLRDINNKVGRKVSFLFQKLLNFIKAFGIKIKLNVGNLFCQLITSDKIIVINNLTRTVKTKRLNRITTLLETIILNHLEAKVRIITHDERILSIRRSDCVIVKFESFNCITRMLTTLTHSTTGALNIHNCLSIFELNIVITRKHIKSGNLTNLRISARNMDLCSVRIIAQRNTKLHRQHSSKNDFFLEIKIVFLNKTTHNHHVGLSKINRN